MSKIPLDLEILRTLTSAQGLKLSDERLVQILPFVRRAMESRSIIEALELRDTPPAVTFWPLDG